MERHKTFPAEEGAEHLLNGSRQRRYRWVASLGQTIDDYIERWGERIAQGEAQFDARQLIRLAGWRTRSELRIRCWAGPLTGPGMNASPDSLKELPRKRKPLQARLRWGLSALLIVGIARTAHLTYTGNRWAALVLGVLIAIAATAWRRRVPRWIASFLVVLVAVSGIPSIIQDLGESGPSPAHPKPPDRPSVTPTPSVEDIDLAGSLRQTRVTVGRKPFSVTSISSDFWVVDRVADTLSRIDSRVGKVVRTVTVPERPVAVAAGMGSVFVASNAGSVTRINGRTNEIMWTRQSGTSPAGVTVYRGSAWVTDVTTDMLLRLNPKTGRITGRVPIPGDPISVASGEGYLWVVSVGQNEVWKIDPTRRPRVAGKASLDHDVFFAAFAEGGLWVSAPDEDRVLRLDAESLEVTDTLVVGDFPTGLASDAESLWVTNTNDNSLERIDLGTRTVTASVQTGPAPFAVASSDHTVAVVEEDSGMVSLIESRTIPNDDRPVAVITTARVVSSPVGLAEGFGSLWISDADTGTVIRLNPVTMRTEATIPVGGSPMALAVSADEVWVGAVDTNRVLRIDPSRNQVTSSVRVLRGPGGLVVADGAVWISAFKANVVQRLDPKTLQITDVIPVEDQPLRMVAGAGGVWVAEAGNDSVALIDATSRNVSARVTVGDQPGAGLATDGNTLWVTTLGDGELVRVDASTHTVTGEVPVAVDAYATAVQGSDIWVTSQTTNALIRVDKEAMEVKGTVEVAKFPQTLLVTGQALWVAATHGGAIQRLDLR